MVKVRAKLTTPEAQRMGVQAAREWEQERQREQAAFEEEQEKQKRKEDFVRPLLEAGVSQPDAEEAYIRHLLENADAHSRAARSAQWESRMKAC